MSKLITNNDIEALAIGAAVLGSGGGSNPAYEKLIAHSALEKNGPITLLDISELKDNDLIMPVAFMGAPIIAGERIASGKETPALLDEFIKHYHKMPSVLMSAEVGGSNIFVPFTLASLNKIPIIDADFVGRAFPELQMNSACVSGINQSVSWITDIFGNTVELNLSCPNTLERYARNITVAAGSRVAFSMYPMSGAQAKCGAVVAGSISRALLIGNTILKARETQADPIEQLAQKSHGIIIGSGVITDIDQTIKNGFLQGTVTIMGPQGEIKIFLQNEYLIIKVNNNIRVTTPDIIALLEKDTGTPLLSSTLSYGIRVVVIILPAPTVWQTQKGLSLVGPRVFGYNCDYVNVTAPAGAVTSK